MPHFENVLGLNLPNQGAFNIGGQALAATAFYQHPIIDEAVEISQQMNGLIDRIGLLEVWNNHANSMGAKIVLTNWWGGISHFNRPRFYTGRNFELLSGLHIDLFSGLNDDPKSLVTRFLQNGDLQLDGVGISFFTKYFQFASQSRNLQPFIIADKWTLLAVKADHISRELDVDWLNVDIGNRIVRFSELNAATYLLFNDYFVSRALELGVSPFYLEERVFGWRGKGNHAKNPRHMGVTLVF